MAKQKGTSLPALKAQLAKDKIAPVYLLAGEDGFLADEAQRLILDAIRARAGDCSVNRYDANEAALADILDDLRTQDLFSSTRLVVVSPAAKLVQNHGASLAKYADHPAADSTLILAPSTVCGL